MDAREKLIRSTQALLWERGYVGTSPKAIQQRAGVGQGSMYHHFGGKSDLALAAIERCSEQIKSFAKDKLQGPGTAYERIEAFLLQERNVLQGCQLGRLTADPEIVVNDNLHRPVHETFDWLQQKVSAVIREGIADGQFDPELEVEDTAAAITGILQGGYVLAKAAGNDEPYFRAVRGMLALLKPKQRPNE
ncbi:TetR/AcrR family transcriptional regulator [Desulfobulbus rhabdoformis]|jgi:AcrR family transcriptional regulator|uniref:TetR/AcrR family transcriptional regulator n=1 Tax=Desulfobulbus rhabdoformis TaxID=34032 RepID=UPI00196374BC|nr:TetR/AcrR family transcriptional regulator [Desulfobulbus rhabdoformis]MBM9614235.1 TetR/AcrR family transcriptional regulator [Desulfobulbus rhabdoformis]